MIISCRSEEFQAIKGGTGTEVVKQSPSDIALAHTRKGNDVHMCVVNKVGIYFGELCLVDSK